MHHFQECVEVRIGFEKVWKMMNSSMIQVKYKFFFSRMRGGSYRVCGGSYRV